MEFKSHLRWRSGQILLSVAFLVLVSFGAKAQSNVTVRVMSANITGNSQVYGPTQIRIFQGLKPDVICIQEFKYGGSTAPEIRSFVDQAFGTNFVYYREPLSGGGDIPNGVISRYPIITSGRLVDTQVANRGFAWAQIDLPGTNDLYVVSVHLLTSTATIRGIEATNLKNFMQTNFPANAWMILAGDFNTGSRTESPCMTTLKTFLSDLPVPVDNIGNSDTSGNRNKPHDYVLPSFNFTNREVATVYPNHAYPNGLVFDSRVYSVNDLTNFVPVQQSDSDGAQHMAIVKDFLISTVNSTSPPAITAQPASQTVAPNSTAVLSVTATGTAPLAYQWLFNGTNISGATTNPFVLSNAQETDSGIYAVFITNNIGSILSSNAFLNVTNIPPNITSQPAGLSIATSSNATLTVTATGTAPLAYQWLFNGSNIFGATTNPFVLNNAQTTNSGNYSVIVTNTGGSILSSNALLTVTNVPVSITTQPQGQSAGLGTTVMFTVNAKGTSPLAYQWQFASNDIPSATASSLTLNNVQTENAGGYRVIITNSAGSVTSSIATLTVVVGQPVVIARWTFNSTIPDGDVNTGVTTPATGTGTAALLSGNTAAFVTGDTTLDPAGNTDNSGWNVASFPTQGTGNKTGGARFNVSTIGNQNVMVTWSSRGSDSGSRYGRLQYSTNSTAFVDFPVAFTNGTSFIRRTNSLSSFSTVNNNANFAFRLVAEFESTAVTNGNENYVAVNNPSYSTGGTMRYDMVTVWGFPIVTSVPPVITIQPQSQSTTTTSNATLSVTATGTAPLAYQWLFNGTNISGAMTNPFVLNNAQTTDSGNYSVLITNIMGSIVSSNALLTVTNIPPDIAAQPLDLTILAGSNATFSVTPTGTAPLGFQWRFNDANISGATTNPFTLNNAQEPDSGNYSVLVTGPGGSILSSDALLTVTNLPVTTPALLSLSTFSDNQFQFYLTGSTGSTYVVQSSTNLMESNWISLFTNISPFTFTNMSPPLPEQYFRAISLP